MNVEVRHAARQTGEQRRFCTFGCSAVAVMNAGFHVDACVVSNIIW